MVCILQKVNIIKLNFAIDQTCCRIADVDGFLAFPKESSDPLDAMGAGSLATLAVTAAVNNGREIGTITTWKLFA